MTIFWDYITNNSYYVLAKKSETAKVLIKSMDGGLVNVYPWSICVIIGTHRPSCRGGWSVINYPKKNVLGLGSRYNQQSRGRLCAWGWISPHSHDPPGSDDPIRSRVFSSRLWRIWESSPLITLPVLRVSFRCNLFMYLVIPGFYFKPT